MKQFGFLLAVLSLALVTSCSKDEEVVVNNQEPLIPMTSRELTGEFEVEWDFVAEPTVGTIVVNNEYIIVDELPAEGIFKYIASDIQDVCLDHPETKAMLADSIGNLFFASSYQYPKTDLEIKYQLDSYSNPYYVASISSIRNTWSETSTAININYAAPYLGKTIVIDPAEPNTISFSVEADGVPYRIDLVTKEHECTAEYNMNTGLWRFQYWFNTYRFINLQTGQHWDMKVVWEFLPRRTKEDTILLGFYATKLTGSVEERVILL